MRIVSRKALRQFWEQHPDARIPLESWYRTVKDASWRNITEVRAVFPSADPAGICTIFNIKGNHYRLIAAIHYNLQRVYIRNVLTHAEYDRGKWKSDCSC